MGYKIGNNAGISDNQDGDFGVIRVNSGNQIIIGGRVQSPHTFPPSAGQTAAYFAGGGTPRGIPYGYNLPRDFTNGILDPATPGVQPFLGIVQPSPAGFDDIDKFSFASEGTASTVGELVQQQKFAATGVNDKNHGFILGGGAVKGNQAPGSDLYGGGSYGLDMTPPVDPEDIVTGTAIEKYNFANETNASVVPTMNTPRFHHGTVDFNDSSSGFAYSAGGYKINPYGPYAGALTTIEKFTMSSLATASEPATLSPNGSYGMYTVQSAEHGYFINGHSRNNTPNPQINFPPSRVPTQILLPSILGNSRVDKINAVNATVTAGVETFNNKDGRSFGAGVSSLEYGYIAGGTIAGQRVRDREPGSTNANWGPPSGAWLDPTNPRYPEAAHHDVPGTNPPGPVGGQLSGWLLGYGITHFLSGTPQLMYDYEDNGAPPIPNFPAPSDSIDGANNSDFTYLLHGKGRPTAPGSSGMFLRSSNDPDDADGSPTFTAPDGTQIAKFLYTAEETNPYTGKLYNSYPYSGHRFQQPEEVNWYDGSTNWPTGLSNGPQYGNNDLTITEAGVFWSTLVASPGTPTPLGLPFAYTNRDDLIATRVPYPARLADPSLNPIEYGDITFNQMVETFLYSVEYNGQAYPPSYMSFTQPPADSPAARTFDLAKRYPTGGYYGSPVSGFGGPEATAPSFAVFSNGRAIPLKESWAGDVITNGLFTDSRWNIEKFPFALSEAVSSEVLDFQFTGYDFHDWDSDGSPFAGTPTRIGMTGASSSTYGYLAGGGGFGYTTGDFAPYNPGNASSGFGSLSFRYKTISKFPFAIRTGNSTDVGELTSGGYNQASFQE